MRDINLPQTYTLILPFPPSQNGYYRSIPMGKSTRQIISKKGREFRDSVELRVALARANGDIKETLTGRLRVAMWLDPPDRRKRDLDNYLKAALDGMTKAGVWVDDEQIDQLEIYRGLVEKPGQVVVNIQEI